VLEADNGEEAFKIVQSHPSLGLDMVITDMVMRRWGQGPGAVIRLMYPASG